MRKKEEELKSATH